MKSIVLSLSLMSVAGVVLGGCEDKGIGGLCDLRIDGGTTDAGAGPSSETRINAAALDCPSRICLKEAALAGSGAIEGAPICSALCSSGDDCSDGLTDSMGTDGKCRTSFVCAVATTVGPFACRKQCVCKDYFPNGVIEPGRDVCP